MCAHAYQSSVHPPMPWGSPQAADRNIEMLGKNLPNRILVG